MQCDMLHIGSGGGEQELSSQRVSIPNLLCDALETSHSRRVDYEDRDRSPNADLHVMLADESSTLGGVAITEDILREHLHLPLQVVAKKFWMCTTAFKKLCRRFSISKWPHRQLSGIDKKITVMLAELNYLTVDKASARRNLVVLEEGKTRLSRVVPSHLPLGSGR